MPDESRPDVNDLLRAAESLRWTIPDGYRDRWVESIYAQSSAIADRHVQRGGSGARARWGRRLDQVLTHRWFGLPVMVLLLGVVLWLTIIGSNVPSSMLATLLLDRGHPLMQGLADALHFPAWLKGLTVDGMYLTVAWVVSVMLPPMAIFFPLFTILEDFGYLPRVAFNMDNLFRKAGAHGKQALTMCMGFGCNAAGVIATRVIDSPRERLIAIITNNFALCNGRWPTQILIASLFLGSLAPAGLAGLVASTSVLVVALLGVSLTLVCSWLLSRTVLKGQASTFSLELPPYRPPNILRTLYTSLIDRTIFVLWRAVLFALPAGAAIWLVGNIPWGDTVLANVLVHNFDPVAALIGLNGVILLAYIVAIPANEIVVPAILMLTVLATGITGVGEQGAGVMFEVEGDHLEAILTAGGWTLRTAVCLMVFSLCHNPCSTTIYTIYKETGSAKWTAVATFLPIAVGIVLCGAITLVWSLFGG